MAHQFTIQSPIEGISLSEFNRLAQDVSLHEKVCRRIPGKQLEILESSLKNNIYTLKWAYNLDVNIPDIAKKLLKDRFRLERTDVTYLDDLKSTVELGANLPLQASCERIVQGNDRQIEMILKWWVKVKVPLIGTLLEKHAEGEIRKFSDLEIEIVEDELKRNLKL